MFTVSHTTDVGSMLAHLEKNIGNQIPIFLKIKKISEWFNHLETYLDVKSTAEECKEWSDNSNYYVYTYSDVTDLYVPIVYVGIGHGRRALSHWNTTHSTQLGEYLDYWKKNNLQQNDVLKFVIMGLKQRQAAALETLIIDLHDPACNVLRYWAPDMSHERSDKQRQKVSEAHMGKVLSNQTLEKIGAANTNNLTLELWFKGKLVRTFFNTSQTKIAKWIFDQYQITVGKGTLWSTITRDTDHRGFQLVLVNGKILSNDPLVSIKKRIASSPILMKDTQGKLRVFISVNSASEILDIAAPNIRIVLKGDSTSTNGYCIRKLTNEEIQKNISKWPVYHKLSIDGVEEISLNLSQSAKKHGLKKSTLTLIEHKNQDYKISQRKHLTCKLVQNHFDEELFGFEVEDDLSTPNQPQAAPGHWNQKENHLIELRKIKPSSITDWGRKSVGSLSAAKTKGWHRDIFKSYCEETGVEFNVQDPWTYESVFQVLKGLNPRPEKITDWQKLHQNSYRWAATNNQQHNLMRDLFNLDD